MDELKKEEEEECPGSYGQLCSSCMGWRRQRDRSGHAGLFAGVAFKVTSHPVIGCFRSPSAED